MCTLFHMLEVNVKVNHSEIRFEIWTRFHVSYDRVSWLSFMTNLLVTDGNEFYHSLKRLICFPLQRIKENLNPNSEHFRTAIVALGHVAYNLPDKYPVHIKNIVSRKVRLLKFFCLIRGLSWIVFCYMSDVNIHVW